MKLKTFNELHNPIYGFDEKGVFISKEKGILSFGYKVHYSTIYEKNREHIDSIKSIFNRIIDILGENYLIQKTEFFLNSKYQTEKMNSSYIEEVNSGHFRGRIIRKQHSYIFFSLVPEDYLKYDSYRTNSFLKKESKGQLFNPVIDSSYIKKEKYQEFLDVKDQMTAFLESSEFKAELLHKEEDIKKVFKLWRNLSHQEEFSDIIIDKGNIHLGDKKLRSFTVESLEQLPDFLPEFVNDSKKGEHLPIPKTYLSPLGLEVEEEHILNQFFFIPPQEKYLKELKSKQNVLNNFANFFSKVENQKPNKSLSLEEEKNKIFSEQLSEFRKNLNETGEKVILTHINVIAQSFKTRDKTFSLGIKPNTIDTLDIYFSTCPANGIGLPTDLYFPITQKQAFSFFYAENFSQGNSSTGLRVIDTISGTPVHIDLFRTPKKLGIITNYNFWGVGESGSGKSFVFNKIMMHQFLIGDHIFIVDGSSSYERATKYVRHITNGEHGFFMKISQNTKIGLNPFILHKGEEIKDKVIFLGQLLMNIINETKEEEIIETFLRDVLYRFYEESSEYSFNYFYEFFEKNAQGIVEKARIQNFVDPFKYIYLLREFYKGGSYDYLLNNEDPQLKNLKKNRYITFQIKELKDNPRLFSIVTFLLSNLYKEKLYDVELLDKIKVITYDEVWVVIDNPILANLIRDMIKTVRSQNGATIFITQEPEDFLNSSVIKNTIINNSELGIVTSLEKYIGKKEALRDALSLTESQLNHIFSIGKHVTNKFKCREFALLIGRSDIKKFALEVPAEEASFYESDPDNKVILNEIERKNGNNPIITAKEYAQHKNNKITKN